MRWKLFVHPWVHSLCVAAALVVSTAAAVLYIHELHSETATLVTDSIAKLRTAEELAFAVRDIRNQLYQYALTGDPSLLEPLPELGDDVEQWLRQARAGASTAAEERFVADIEDDFHRIHHLIDDLSIREAPGDKRQQARELGEVLTRQGITLCHLFLDYSERSIEQAEAQHRSNIVELQYLVVLTGLLIPLGGVLVGFMVSRSVTRELQRSREELLRAEQLAAVGHLAAGMAHELRNPLTAIMMMVQTAKPDEPADLQVIEDEVRRMERTIQACLDFAKPRQPQRALCDLRDAVEGAYRLLEARIRRQQIEFDLVQPDQPVPVLGDRQLLHQMFVNLLLNAIESTGPRGGMGVRIEMIRPGGPARIAVWDNGPGIAPEMLPALFDPFVTSKATGTGLGLSVCRQIMLSHEGRIEAKNRSQGGAEIIVTLPCQGVLQHADPARHRRRTEHSPVLPQSLP